MSITAKSSTDIYYLMHWFTHDDKASREVLAKLFTLFELVDTAGIDCKRTIQSEMTDYEDAIMVESAGMEQLPAYGNLLLIPSAIKQKFA